MINNILNTYLSKRFFTAFGICIVVCVLGYLFPILFTIVWVLLSVLVIATLYDAFFLYQSNSKIKLVRNLIPVLPLGDITKITIGIENQFPYKLNANLIDELPSQFQERKFLIPFQLLPKKNLFVNYEVRPIERGVYNFGKCNLFVHSSLGLIQFRHQFDEEKEVSVYPSVVQMKKHELAAIKHAAQFHGLKKIRRLGHSYEFEQIKNYVTGDDIRSINWKATSRKGTLMVNQYGDEKSQQIYSIVDRSRVMMLPFNGLSLMDYAINTSLVISNIALKKYDKAGFISFDQKVGTIIKADNRSNQLKRIIEALYREKESPFEANYQLLHSISQRFIKHRSLLILYTNFESQYALERNIPLLRRINRNHILLVVFFENSEMEEYSNQNADDLMDIYTTTMASKLQLDKKKMLMKLNQFGIQTLLTKPEDLSMNTVNKYLEFKAKGWI